MRGKDANETNKDDCWRCAADDADVEWVERQGQVRRAMAASKEDETSSAQTNLLLVSIA